MAQNLHFSVLNLVELGRYSQDAKQSVHSIHGGSEDGNMSLQERGLRKEAFDHLLAQFMPLKSENSTKCLRLFLKYKNLESEHNGKRVIRLYSMSSTCLLFRGEVLSSSRKP